MIKTNSTERIARDEKFYSAMLLIIAVELLMGERITLCLAPNFKAIYDAGETGVHDMWRYCLTNVFSL